MDNAKRNRLEAAGWRVGSAEDFLGLSPGEAMASQSDESPFCHAVALGLGDLDEDREMDLAAARKRLGLPVGSHRS